MAMQSARPLTAEELVRNVQSKLLKAGLDCTKYQRQLKDIASLFEPERSRVELISEGSRAGAWEMFCYFKGIRHCFHSAREVAATFGIPIVRTEGAKRKREDEEVPRTEPRPAEGGDDLYSKLAKSDPPKKKMAALKKSGRMGSRFQNQKLVKAINAHVGMEVVCGNLRARLVSANLGGMTFELLDDHGKPCGDMVPPSQLAKRSCLAHQNNAWKSIKVKVDGITLDAWVCRLQEEIEAEDGGTDGALHAAMFMQRVDEMRGPQGKRARSADDDTATADEDDEYNSGAESDPQRSYSGGSPSKGLKLLSGAAVQRIKHNGQQAESLHDMPVASARVAAPKHDDPGIMRSSADRNMDLPAAEATPQVDQAVKLTLTIVDPDGAAVNPAMALRLARLEELHANTTKTLRKTVETLCFLLSEAEKLGISVMH